MTRQLQMHTASLSLEELLGQSTWFGQLDEPARRRVRQDASSRAVAQGESLGHHGEIQHAWFGMLEGLIKWSITAYDGHTVTLGGQSVGSWFGDGTAVVVCLVKEPKLLDASLEWRIDS